MWAHHTNWGRKKEELNSSVKKQKQKNNKYAKYARS